MRFTKVTTRRKVALGLAPLLAAGTLGVAIATANAAPSLPTPGPLTITPATGTGHGSGDAIFTATAPCPAPADEESGGSVFVKAQGAGFPAESILVSPNFVVGGGNQSATLGSTWNTIAENASAGPAPDIPLPLSGVLNVTLQCLDLDLGTSYADFTGQIEFTPTGTGIESTYAVVQGPGPTTPPPPPGPTDQRIEVDVPPITVGDFAFTVDENPLVKMTLASLSSGEDFLVSTGDINTGLVTDSRVSNTGVEYDWVVNGQVSDFVGVTPANMFDGNFLGWEPSITDRGTGGIAGAVVAPGFPTGDGLSISRILASADSATVGTADLDAGLTLNIPTSTPVDTYTATLTLTAMS